MIQVTLTDGLLAEISVPQIVFLKELDDAETYISFGKDYGLKVKENISDLTRRIKAATDKSRRIAA